MSFERSSLACKCAGNLPVCEKFAQNDAVFVGRVESVEPDFDFWAGPRLPSDSNRKYLTCNRR